MLPSGVTWHQLEDYLGQNGLTDGKWRAQMKRERSASKFWYMVVIGMLIDAWSQKLITSDGFMTRAGVMVQIATTMDEVIYIDEQLQKHDPVGHAKRGWRELINRRASAIEAVVNA